jgi:predicted regulator of Ras-like GTPase activity (Roadblock/LC7/MglB family)
MKEVEMDLEPLLDEIKGVNGYMASAIMDFTGEILAANSSATGVDLQVAGATFNDIFRAAHAAAGKVGFKAANDLVIQTPEGVIVMTCTGPASKVHLHVITILAKDGNQALAKMTMHKIAPTAMEWLH